VTTDRENNTGRRQETRSRATPEERAAVNSQRRIQYELNRNQRLAQRTLNQQRLGRAIHGDYRIAFNENIDEQEVPEFTVGPMNVECTECHSLNFAGERTGGDSNVFTLCCQKGKVNLEPLHQTPELIENWLTEYPPGEEAKYFKDNIMRLNANLAFASRQANYDYLIGRGPYCMRIHGMIYHHLSSLRPREGGSRRYAQLYILDNEQATIQRLGIYNILFKQGFL
jgi:hypothetical protein